MIDFRSDTVTQPTEQMRRAMASAPVGDDVYGDDPSIEYLQKSAAEKLGSEAALFCTSGTQANLLALMSHCGRGDEYICGLSAHNFKYEQGGAAVLGSIQPQPVVNQADGTLALEDVQTAIKPDDIHFARTKLVSIENTIGGQPIAMDYWPQISQLCHSHQLKLHIDGARLYNAAVKLNVDIREITQHVDTFTLCLSKGLAAPVGSLLLGPRDFIKQATRIRKMLGGGWRQAGILAAAAQIALDEMPKRLHEDHELAEYLGQRLEEVEQLDVDHTMLQTNIVYARCRLGKSRELEAFLKERDILIFGTQPIRFVTHLDVNRDSVDQLVAAIKEFYR
ncbi:low-specificity L-threonine aldolase [Celerinatantimonas sp. MCCC 1A17872]|uniref:low-specificity L-threonine aldolase n=1 Tax=Celerinatantimonas sp. MCCC 1A17872 TaxID=3177514 RepID=UPI0038BED39C